MTTLGRRKRRLRLLVMIALVTVPAFAGAPGAPADQYDPFTRESLTIRDRLTGLEWDRTVSGAIDLAGARTWCSSRGFRLPTSKELLTLVDENVHFEYEATTEVQKAIDPNAFPGTPSAAFWSSTVVVAQQSKIDTVDFGTGNTFVHDPTDIGPRARCVR